MVDSVSAEKESFCSQLGEALVPTETFGTGERGQRTLLCSRVCIFILYALVAIFFLVSMVTFFLGRVEIIDHRMKYERLEAPSVAICPWEPHTSVHIPDGVSFIAYAIKITSDGVHRLPHKPRACKFDRQCQCLELFNVTLEDVEEDHRGATGDVSEEAESFRERIELHTTVTDPSLTKTLKVGFYDSVDHRPSWCYARQWFSLLGQLRLDSWLVSEARAETFRAMLSGDITNLDRRHFYTYSFSGTDVSVDTAVDRVPTTRISYEFRNFFVVETISAAKSWSLFTCVSLLILLIALSNFLLIWELLFPVHVDGKVQRRAVARPLRWLTTHLCPRLELHHDFDDAPISGKGKDSRGYGAA